MITDSLDDATFIVPSDDVTDDTIEAVTAVKSGLSIEGLSGINSSSASAWK